MHQDLAINDTLVMIDERQLLWFTGGHGKGTLDIKE
jgi:hypothetical protein